MAEGDFNEYVVKDLLADVENIFSRAMFGGYGLYKDGIIFGIIADDELYLKVDTRSKKEYREFGSRPFEYERKNYKKIAMSYWFIPEEILEDRERLEKLVMAAVRVNKKKIGSRKKRR